MVANSRGLMRIITWNIWHGGSKRTDSIVERLAGFETPKRIVVVDEFPTTVGGKILKYKLRAALAAAD